MVLPQALSYILKFFNISMPGQQEFELLNDLADWKILNMRQCGKAGIRQIPIDCQGTVLHPPVRYRDLINTLIPSGWDRGEEREEYGEEDRRHEEKPQIFFYGFEGRIFPRKESGDPAEKKDTTCDRWRVAAGEECHTAQQNDSGKIHPGNDRGKDHRGQPEQTQQCISHREEKAERAQYRRDRIPVALRNAVHEHRCHILHKVCCSVVIFRVMYHRKMRNAKE